MPESRKIVHEGGKWFVYSEDGSKKLGGPYDSEEEAKKRLEQIEYFKHQGNAMTQQIERRILPFTECEVRVKEKDGGQKVITGLAAVFGKKSQDLGGFREIIDRNAFERALERCDIRGLVNHDPSQRLGRNKSGTMRLWTDDRGLNYEIDVPETQVGRDTVTDIKNGNLDGSSFSFNTEEEDGDAWDKDEDGIIRTVRNVRDIYDVGPVTYPAYLDTEVSSRSFDRYRKREESRIAQDTRAAFELEARRRRIRLLKLKIFRPFGLGVTP